MIQMTFATREQEVSTTLNLFVPPVDTTPTLFAHPVSRWECPQGQTPSRHASLYHLHCHHHPPHIISLSDQWLDLYLQSDPAGPSSGQQRRQPCTPNSDGESTPASLTIEKLVADNKRLRQVSIRTRFIQRARGASPRRCVL